MNNIIFNCTLCFFCAIIASCAESPLKNEEYIRPMMIPSTCPAIEYPRAAMQSNVQGITLLKLHVNNKGEVVDSKVKESSGSEILDIAATKFLGSCKYKPATLGGKPITTWFDMKYNWKIEDSSSKK